MYIEFDREEWSKMKLESTYALNHSQKYNYDVANASLIRFIDTCVWNGVKEERREDCRNGTSELE